MIANRDTPQCLIIADLYQCEVRGSTTDIDNKNELHALEFRSEIVAMIRNEVVKRRLRFLEQRKFIEARLPRRVDGQCAGYFIERCRHRDNDFLRLHAGLGKRGVPCFKYVTKQPRRCIHRRHPFDIPRCSPGKDSGGPVDRRVR